MAIKIEYPLLPDRDRKKAFMDSLIPESPLKSLGIPMPVCRDIAKNLSSDDIEIRYIEDALVKAIVIFSRKEAFCEKKKKIETLLPYLVSWMLTDVVSSSLFYRKEEKPEVFDYFFSLMDRKEDMTKRLGIVALMDLDFLTPENLPAVLEKICTLDCKSYLLSMAAAWYVATAYTYFADLTVPCFSRLDPQTKRRAMQKCRDSRRISRENKERLKSL